MSQFDGGWRVLHEELLRATSVDGRLKLIVVVLEEILHLRC